MGEPDAAPTSPTRLAPAAPPAPGGHDAPELLLTFEHLAILDALSETEARRAAALTTSHHRLTLHLVALDKSRTGLLTVLAAGGLVRKTDTGGPKSKARTVWLRTPSGTAALAAWKASHP